TANQGTLAKGNTADSKAVPAITPAIVRETPTPAATEAATPPRPRPSAMFCAVCVKLGLLVMALFASVAPHFSNRLRSGVAGMQPASQVSAAICSQVGALFWILSV